MTGFKSAALTAMPAGVDTTPVQPPGMGNLTLLIGWVAWGVCIAAVLGFLGGLVYLIFCALRGDEIQGVKPCIVCLVVAVVAGSAGTFISALS
ncbi:hypothetical protein [Rudaeicoccus suwonensis]|uniref:Uncharacterized protein n=1 Tax=Rudaeicoccus suwonensis TaxID=657409 RepID=A0A561DVI2_9MICO|nr:hypothetical protein [Rudaeicoccus suwonensis]TWE07369.1 hypothetical protein BKA23_3382 [Rudaeicoccus suwonensis]